MFRSPLFAPRPVAAAVLGIGLTHLHGLVNEGKLHPVHEGKKTLFAVTELCEYAANKAAEAGVSESSVEALRLGNGYFGPSIHDSDEVARFAALESVQ